MKLREYQQRALTHALNHPRCALHLEPGLGKTAIAIAAMKQCSGPALVVAPKRVIDHTWPAELQRWWPEARVVSLSVPPAKRAAALASPAEVYLLNYELLDKVIGEKGECSSWRWPMLILDESTKIKSRAARSFKALRRHSASFGRVIELTGTPSPNGLQDLWSQIYLLDRGERLGRTLTAYRERWFRADRYGYGYDALPHAAGEISARIADICLAMTGADHLDLPEMVINDIIIDLPPHAKAAYKAMRTEAVATIGDTTISATTAATVANRLLQITSGAAYNEGETVRIHDAKLDALSDLIDELGGESLLIAYQFRSELAAMRKLGIAELRDNPDTVARWNSGQLKLLAIHPASGGIGLNLQHGGRHICWTTPTYNLEHWLQTNARLHRSGQTGSVIVHRLLAANTLDRRVVGVVEGKHDLQAALMAALK